MKPVSSSVLTVALLAAGACPAATTAVRVDGGAPRLTIDGRPVRGRMFFGAGGISPVRVEAAAPQQLSLEFTALEDEPRAATMHLRFGQEPGTIALDDIRVVDLDTGREVFPVAAFEGGPGDFEREWTFWPTGEANTVAAVTVAEGRGRDGTRGLLITLRAPPDGAWPDWHLYHRPNLALQAGHRYRVSLWIHTDRERRLAVAFYRPGAVFTLLGAPAGGFEQQIRLAAAAGVGFVSFPCPLPWPRPGEAADWSGAETACRQVLQANPQALLLPRIGMNPPAWWLQEHPEAVMLWEDGSHKGRAFCVASPAYRRDAAERLAALVEHLEAAFGDRMAGYHPCGQHTGEWFYEGTWAHPLSDYSEAMRDAWRQWLASRYGSAAALEAAWGRPGAAPHTAELPTPAERHAAPAGILRDPRTERHLIDYARFQQEAMADCVRALAGAVRRASGGRRLVVFFYGYGFEFAACATGASVSGHYALRRVLDCPDIDVLCSPISYWDRGLGQSAPCMSAAESVALAGKLWLREDDTATHLSSGRFPGWTDKARNPWESVTQLQRNVAQEALRNQASWWMDLGATGWFNDPALWEEMARLSAIDEPLLQSPVPYEPQVAAILDEHAMLYVAEGGHVVTRPGIYEARTALGRMGAPYGQYLLDDAASGRVPARLKVFLNAWVVPGALRERLLQAVRNDVTVWCYAPGCLDDNGPAPDGMRALTGFDLTPANPPAAWAEPTPDGRALGLTRGFGVNGPVRPLFAARPGPGVRVLAAYPDGTAAVALREAPAPAALFVGAPGLTSELLRAAARLAGVHLFTETDCNVYANGPFVALHAAQDGDLLLDTGAPGEVEDVLARTPLGQGPRVALTLRKGETRILRCAAPSRPGNPGPRP